jgi:GH15 family glucan-1,4-alpha-glucosidase
MGYKDEPYRFFEFCRRALNAGGYLMHKYRADGALGSSWHPYLHEDGVVAPPIQTDETALVLFVFSQFYHLHGDHVLLKEFYEPMIVPMADFLSSYIDDRSGLPKASYDLWEERFLTTTYTTAVTYAALMAAADLAELRKDQDSAVKWRSAADDIHAAAKQRLFNTDRQAFYKGIHMSKDGNISEDSVIDMSSLYGAFMYGLFPVDSEETVKAVTTVEHLMMSKSTPPGYPRYENDTYRRSDEQSLGNVWFVTSLWMAQYYLETNRHEEAKKIIDWARDSMWPTGVLSEQVDPVSGEEISVAPLAWSQAEYLSTLLDTIIEDQ